MTDTPAVGRPLPRGSLQSGHWRDISSANRRTGSVDPEAPHGAFPMTHIGVHWSAPDLCRGSEDV